MWVNCLIVNLCLFIIFQAFKGGFGFFRRHKFSTKRRNNYWYLFQLLLRLHCVQFRNNIYVLFFRHFTWGTLLVKYWYLLAVINFRQFKLNNFWRIPCNAWFTAYSSEVLILWTVFYLIFPGRIFIFIICLMLIL